MVLRASLLLLRAACAEAETQQGWACDLADENCLMQTTHLVEANRIGLHRFRSGGRLAGASHMAMDETDALSSGDISNTDSSAESGLTYSVGLRKHMHREAVVLAQGAGKVKHVHKLSYFGETFVGGQNFSVVYDTGSGNLILPDQECQEVACRNHKKYDMKKSTTGSIVDCRGAVGEDSVHISFGAGDVKGSCVRDEICLGKRACVQGDFISADYMSNLPFALFSFDGVQGLGLPDLSQDNSFNLMQNLIGSGKLKHPIFAVFLSDHDAEESKVTFGSHLPEHMHGELFWQPVTRHTGYWEVQISDITINNRPKDLCKNCHVAVDTGTSSLAGPPTVIQNMKKTLDVKSDCSNYDDLPLLGFQLSNTKVLNLQPRDYVEKKDGSCTDTFMELDLPPPTGPLFIFGIPFLQKFYTVYDQEHRRVGFAVAKHSDVTDEDAAKIISVAEM